MTTGLNSTASVRQHAVSVEGIADLWAMRSGGVPSVDVGEAYNGGAEVPDLTMGRKKYSNVTVTRPFNPIRDRPVIRFIEANMGKLWTTTITDQDLDANGIAIGEPVVFTGCVPVSVTDPEYNTDSSDASTVVIEFKVQAKK